MRNSNVHLWVYANGDFVKITLSPEETISCCTVEQDEEGFIAEWQSWTHEGTFVSYERYMRQRDCDGLTERTFTATCAIRDIAKIVCETSPRVRLPLWQSVTERYRDHTAEKEGY